MSKYTFFYKSKLSQWHMVDFVVANVKYCCCEQYMMAQKAILFGDSESMQAIMATNSPREHQLLGRTVKNYVQDTWDTHKYRIVYEGNYNRFSQNAFDWQLLDATGDTILVEASPIDRVWGIGMDMKDPDINDESKWRGQNLLGKVLTQVRDDIRKEKVFIGV
jgi:ribA/ribD-fused uncharacterized protein